MSEQSLASPVRNRSSALGWILGSLFLYAFSPSVTIFLSRRGLNAFEMFFLYSLGSVIFLAMANPIIGRGGRTNKTRGSLSKTVLLGLFGYTLYYCLYLVAMTRTSTGGVPMVMMANYLWPLFTFILIALWVEHRAVRVLEWTGLVISAVGVYFSRASGFSLDQLGSLQWPLIALAGAIVWGWFSAATQKWKIEGISPILIYNLVAVVVSGIWMLVQGFGHLIEDPTTTAIAIVAGMLFNALATCFYFAGLERRPTAGQLAVFNLTPVLALMVMALWQKVPMGWPVWVGAVLIITGIMLARMGRLAIVKKSTMS